MQSYCSVSVLSLSAGIQERVKGKQKRDGPRKDLEDGDKANEESGNESKTSCWPSVAS